MPAKKLGKQTIKFDSPPSLLEVYSIVGSKEGKGPLANYFDEFLEDELFQEKTWEKAESKMLRECIKSLIFKANISENQVDCILAGDLLNQCSSSNYAMREINAPFLGLYGACSTMAESLILGSIILDGGYADYLICGASSHFCSAEKQFRYPLELGSQRTPTSQWTVTGAGTTVLCNNNGGPSITKATIGKIIDLGINDANNMGAAMAPAAADTIICHFENTKESVDEYDLVVTGDLGYVGLDITRDLLEDSNIKISNKITDCGIMIFDREDEDIHSGGSGCGCSASVLCSYLYRQLKEKVYKKILFVATGALMSPLSLQQGETIPSIAHAVTIES